MPFNMREVVAMLYKAAAASDNGEDSEVLITDDKYEYDVTEIKELDGDIVIDFTEPRSNPDDGETADIIPFDQTEKEAVG